MTSQYFNQEVFCYKLDALIDFIYDNRKKYISDIDAREKCERAIEGLREGRNNKNNIVYNTVINILMSAIDNNMKECVKLLKGAKIQEPEYRKMFLSSFSNILTNISDVPEGALVHITDILSNPNKDENDEIQVITLVHSILYAYFPRVFGKPENEIREKLRV